MIYIRRPQPKDDWCLQHVIEWCLCVCLPMACSSDGNSQSASIGTSARKGLAQPRGLSLNQNMSATMDWHCQLTHFGSFNTNNSLFVVCRFRFACRMELGLNLAVTSIHRVFCDGFWHHCNFKRSWSTTVVPRFMIWIVVGEHSTRHLLEYSGHETKQFFTGTGPANVADGMDFVSGGTRRLAEGPSLWPLSCNSRVWTTDIVWCLSKVCICSAFKSCVYMVPCSVLLPSPPNGMVPPSPPPCRLPINALIYAHTI